MLDPGEFLGEPNGKASAWLGEYVINSLETRFAADPIFWARLDIRVRDDITEVVFWVGYVDVAIRIID